MTTYISYGPNSKIKDLMSQSVQGLELLCKNSACKHAITLSLAEFQEGLTLDIIQSSVACSKCNQSTVYTTPKQTFHSNDVSLPALANNISNSEKAKQLVQERVAVLMKQYPDYVDKRAREIAKAEFARNTKLNWNALSTEEQKDIIENYKSKIRETHGKRTVSLVAALTGFPIVI